MNTASWDFSLANYGAVWAFLAQLGLLMIFLLAQTHLLQQKRHSLNC